MSKQTTEELVKELRYFAMTDTTNAAARVAAGRAARVIEAMGREIVASRNDLETRGYESATTYKARAATDEVIALAEKEGGGDE